MFSTSLKTKQISCVESRCDENMDLLDGIGSLRSVRKFSTMKVEPAKIKRIIQAATMAPSSSNSQPWHFIVITKEEKKRELGEIFLRTWTRHVSFLMDGSKPDRVRRIYRESTQMVTQTQTVPLLVIACIDRVKASRAPEAMYASIYPSLQNMMLAAWALGIGSCLTTNGTGKSRGEAETAEVLGLPSTVKIAATVYMGYPQGNLSPPTRQPILEVIHEEEW